MKLVSWLWQDMFHERTLIEEQVKKLDELFRQSFNYPTKVVELQNASKPQLQLNLAVMKFVRKYNGPHNLLIVYYTGHGSFHETSELLELHAYGDPGQCHLSDYQKLTVQLYLDQTLKRIHQRAAIMHLHTGTSRRDQ